MNTTRTVRVIGRVIMIDRPAPSSDDKKDGRSPDPPVDPAALGIPSEDVLGSLRIVAAETGASTEVTGGGSFALDVDLPVDANGLTLRFDSRLLLLESGATSMRVHVANTARSADLDDVRMIPAVNAQPMYNGRPIRPADLKDPVVAEEFNRQMAEAADRIMKPPSPTPP
jgi:hypothetical protein